MSDELKVSKSKVLEAANSCPQTKQALKILFPEAFKENKPFIKKGALFLRKSQKGYVYMLTEFNGCLNVKNLTLGTFWNPKALYSADGFTRPMTEDEFKSMTGYGDLTDFVVLGDPYSLRTVAIAAGIF